MNALAQWEQERALMQALNSSDMETSVQACSGIINIAAGGNFSLGSGGPISMVVKAKIGLGEGGT
jgi:hypothetical protein